MTGTDLPPLTCNDDWNDIGGLKLGSMGFIAHRPTTTTTKSQKQPYREATLIYKRVGWQRFCHTHHSADLFARAKKQEGMQATIKQRDEAVARQERLFLSLALITPNCAMLRT